MLRTFATMIWLLLIGLTPLAAAELIMFEETGCEWCERWHEEIGVVYDRTPEGRQAPLRQVDLDDDVPADLKRIKAVVYTPTFVLFENGKEIGRIIGYPGEDFFWAYLDQMLQKIGKPKRTDPRVRAELAVPQ